jgi:hypothetical protein
MADCIILTGGTYAPNSMSRIQRSLGPYRIASALHDAGYTTFVLDFIIHMTNEEITSVLKQHLTNKTLWVGFSSTFFWRDNSKSFKQDALNRMYYDNPESVAEIMDYIKQNSNAKILYGGAKAPFFLADSKIDYYVTGYADNSTVALTNYIKTNDIEFLVNPSPIDIQDSTSILIDSNNYEEPKLNNIKTYWWDKQFNILPKEGLPIELARGCIFKCKFCTYPLLGKKKGTYLRDPSELKDDLIKMWEVHGTESYYFTDDTFNDDNDKIEQLHKIFTELPFKPKFSCYLRIDLLNKYPEQADLLTEMGLVGTYLGIETFQPESARAIGKGLSPHKVKDRLYWLSEKWKNKVNIGAGFILGLPYDTYQYFDELYSWCSSKDVPIQQISFYPLYLFNRKPGSRLDAYTSEFSLRPEIYGYEFNIPGDNMTWNLKTQNLDYNICSSIANDFSAMISVNNKVAEFQMISNLNAGVELEDLYNLTEVEINEKYDMAKINKLKIDQYKTMVGAI